MYDVRLPLPKERDAIHGRECMRGDLIETMGLVSPVVEVRSRDLQLRQRWMRFPNLDQPVRIAKRQRLNEYRIDDAEQGRIRADRERDR